MAYEQNVQNVTAVAAADLSTQQFYPVVIGSTSGRVNTSGTKGSVVYGVLQNKPAAAGRGALVAVGGITKCVVNTAVAAKSIAYDSSLIIGSTLKRAMVSSTGGTAYRFARAREALSTGHAKGIIAVQITNEGPTSTA